MSMTTQNFGKQLNPRPAAQPQGVPVDGAQDDSTNEFDPDVVVQAPVKGLPTPARPSTSKVVKPNSGNELPGKKI